MNYYLITENGYIKRIELSNCSSGQNITETEYNEITAIIQNRPTAEGKGYRLKADLTWEEYDLPLVPEPSDDDEISTDEALNILLGGAT